MNYSSWLVCLKERVNMYHSKNRDLPFWDEQFLWKPIGFDHIEGRPGCEFLHHKILWFHETFQL